MIRSNNSSTGGVIWTRADFVPPFLFCSRGSFFGRFTPLHFLMVCRRISELYCEVEWSAASRCTPIVGIRMRMPCLRETRALARTILRSGRLKFNAPRPPIFLNASPPEASLDFRFQIFWMERTRRTHGDYSLLCNTLLHLGRS